MLNTTSVVVIITMVTASVPALAVEGAVGRSAPGVWVMPQGGVIGPHPGFSFTLMLIGYVGSLSGTQHAAIAGTLEANVSAGESLTYLAPHYVYKTANPKINLASKFTTPVSWVGVTATAQMGDMAHSLRNANAGPGDTIMSPLIVGIHFSETNNLAINTMIFAPTGEYTRNNLSNTGLGVWTFMPSIAHTYTLPKEGLELDNFVGFDIYRHDATTNYTSGTMFHWDGMLLKYFLKNRAALGGIVSNVTQLNDDRGPLADVLHGLQGSAWGTGPIALVVAKHEKPRMMIQFRWVREFEVRNLLKGDVFMLGFTVKLD